MHGLLEMEQDQLLSEFYWRDPGVDQLEICQSWPDKPLTIQSSEMASIRDQLPKLNELRNLDESSQKEIYDVAEQIQSRLNLQTGVFSLPFFHFPLRGKD